MHRRMAWVVLAIAFGGVSLSAQQPVPVAKGSAPPPAQADLVMREQQLLPGSAPTGPVIKLSPRPSSRTTAIIGHLVTP